MVAAVPALSVAAVPVMVAVVPATCGVRAVPGVMGVVVAVMRSFCLSTMVTVDWII